VRSSAKPLFVAYYIQRDKIVVRRVSECITSQYYNGTEGNNNTNLCALQIHVIVPDLEIYAENVDERYIVTAGVKTGCR
jgi:hypothetical protein